jgi:lipid-A-disaccharide synthase
MLDNNKKNLMIIAGEISGDLHGASLVKELKAIDPALSICGIGGEKMKEAGMEISFHINRMAYLGFLEVIRHLPFIRKVQRDLLKLIDERKIKEVVLIDYPGFNLNFAKKLKARRIKIVYYISPQVWAWGMGRIKKIKKLVDKMLVVFPFEEEMYKKEGIDVQFIGHPLLEKIAGYNFLSKVELYSKFNLDQDKQLLLILPGSREHEVKKIFPECIKAADKLAKEFDFQIVTICSENIDENIFRQLTAVKGFKVVKGFAYDFMKYARFGIVKSGTSTLESGIFEMPMIIVYRTSSVTYLIGKKLVRLDNIGMANIISGEKIIPELIQNKVNADSIYESCKEILANNFLYKTMKEKLKIIKDKLGHIGASRRAAEVIYSLMNEA